MKDISYVIMMGIILFLIWFLTRSTGLHITPGPRNAVSVAAVSNAVNTGSNAGNNGQEMQLGGKTEIIDGCKLRVGEGTTDSLRYLPFTNVELDQLNIINHKEWNNLTWGIRRPLTPARKLINNLKETPTTGNDPDLGKVCFKTWDACKCDRDLMNLERPRDAVEGNRAPEITAPMKRRLWELEPSFLRIGLKDYYNELYYNDVRYPERPLSIDFAKDPTAYCLANPQLYPCPLIQSRIDLR